jgi:hypothetical protein
LKAHYQHLFTFLASLPLVFGVPTGAVEQPVGSSGPLTNTEKEPFLLRATLVIESSLPLNPGQSWRARLDDGERRHAATVETSTSRDPSQRDHRFNIAAYELDKMLQLGLVVPSVPRTVKGQPAAVTWWLDDVLMSEQERRIKKIDPPDVDNWNEQMQAVRLFDELIANAYRTMSPSSFTSRLWDNLLITSAWQVWLIDHTRAFGITTRLQDPGSLARCERTVFARLRTLRRSDTKRRLGQYLTSGQLDALETRRALIVKHCAGQIASMGERAVLYDLPPRS